MMRRLPLALFLILASGCGPSRAPSIRIDPALASLVPSGTILLAGARLDALRSTPLYRKLGADTLGPMLAGVDVKDVWEVLAASDGRETAVLARGRFSTTGLEPEVSLPGAARHSYKGYTLIGTGAAAVAFVNPTTAIAGRTSAIHAVIDGRGDSTGPPAPLADEISRIAPDTQIWIAGLGQASGAMPQSGNLRNLATALSMVEHFRAAADLRTGVRVSAAALCHSAQDAESLAAALNAFLAFARIGNPRYREAASALRIFSGDRTVQIEGTLPEELVEALAP